MQALSVSAGWGVSYFLDKNCQNMSGKCNHEEGEGEGREGGRKTGLPVGRGVEDSDLMSFTC